MNATELTSNTKWDECMLIRDPDLVELHSVKGFQIAENRSGSGSNGNQRE